MTETKAVIEIGSTGIRLLVVELTQSSSATPQWHTVDKSELPIPLGRDVFTTGIVSRDTLLSCLHIIYRFQEQLKAWYIEPENIAVIATSALRLAQNRDAVLDRIMVKTGFRVKVIDGIEQNRLMYLGVWDSFADNRDIIENHNAIILEVGGGATDIMLMAQGKIAGVHTLKLGTIIIEQHLKSMASARDTYRFLEDYIRVMRSSMDQELNFSNITQFVAVGQDAQIIAKNCGVHIGSKLWRISREQFSAFTDEVQSYSAEECVLKFKISYNEAQTFAISLMTYKFFLQFTQADYILVPNTNTREGLILSVIQQPNQELQENFLSQIAASAWNLARRYKTDEQHADSVRIIALKLFDGLKDELGLAPEGRIILEVAAILHDIGVFIGVDDHHLHSSYIINHSDIFGLSRDQLDMISQISYGHRGKTSSRDLPHFAKQDRETRMTILKLTALLRIADALDRGHGKKIQDFTIQFHSDTLIIRCAGTHSLALEQRALEEKSNLFEAVFGYKVILS